jgi:hypothetical protein
LFIDNELEKSASSHGKNIQIPPAPSAFLDETSPLSAITFAMGGECIAWGKRVHGILCEKGSTARIPKSTTQTQMGISIKKFLNQTVLIVLGTKISREQVIRYVSNKTGGTHYDNSRGKHNDLAIDRARFIFSYDVSGADAKQNLNLERISRMQQKFSNFPRKVDCVLIQMMITCHLLHSSSAVADLRRIL